MRPAAHSRISWPALIAPAALWWVVPCSAQTSTLSPGVQQQLALSLVSQAAAFEYGEGAPRDPARAVELYCEAARYGSSEAQYSLGWMYANGRGVPRDEAVAATLFGMAASQGHQGAITALTHLPPPGDSKPDCLSAKARPPGAVSLSADNAALFADTDDLDAYVAGLPRDKQRIAELVRGLAPQYKINPRLALAVAVAESNLNLMARSDKGAQGIMQLMPDTATRFGVRKIYDPGQNIRGGLSYLRWLLSYYRGDVLLTVAAYNAGEGAVDRFKGIPPFMETVLYVKRITSFFKPSSHPFDAALATPSPIALAIGEP
ncbi:lytic transglycosylase domain-containing protein [Uliginosibacterium sp. sgz301328]|uniref:lytic transglycosylase domain-containing protein n=1 Tax=Uliginosibacterium sp. sgz301328 TaxID=3243764 RepID=UPI00359CD68A